MSDSTTIKQEEELFVLNNQKEILEIDLSFYDDLLSNAVKNLQFLGQDGIVVSLEHFKKSRDSVRTLTKQIVDGRRRLAELNQQIGWKSAILQNTTLNVPAEDCRLLPFKGDPLWKPHATQELTPN